MKLVKTGIIAQLIVLTSLLLAMQAKASELDAYKVGNMAIGTKLTGQEVAALLAKGRTCVKDGARVMFHSKDITKKHCQKANITGVAVIKVSDIETALATKLLGL